MHTELGDLGDSRLDLDFDGTYISFGLVCRKRRKQNCYRYLYFLTRDLDLV